MADDADIASAREELARQEALSVKKATGPVATGRCLQCDEILDDYKRWCDATCRNDWERPPLRSRY